MPDFEYWLKRAVSRPGELRKQRHARHAAQWDDGAYGKGCIALSSRHRPALSDSCSAVTAAFLEVVL